MSSIDVNSVLSQIRAMQAQMRERPAAPQAATAPAQPGGFTAALQNAVDRVNESQQQSSRLQEAFVRGDRSVDLAGVMVAGARAQVEFKAAVEVRNRLVAAYQDIMNMPV